MKSKKLVLPLLLSASFLSFAPASAAAPDPGIQHPVWQQITGHTYEQDGMKLIIPTEYNKQLLTETGLSDGTLFRVSERASIDAARTLGRSTEGAGWMFSIGCVNTAKLHEMLRSDRPGAEVFATDGNGNHYIFYHPTDVRYERQNTEAMQRDQEVWSQLTRWAREDVRLNFLRVNRLSEETYDTSSVGLALARATYTPIPSYTLSTTQQGPLSHPNGLDATPYLERLISNVRYEIADNSETPDGEYIVLHFPEENLRFDFFRLDGKENYVREVRGDGTETLYLARFTDDRKASHIMQELYNAFAIGQGEELPANLTSNMQ